VIELHHLLSKGSWDDHTLLEMQLHGSESWAHRVVRISSILFQPSDDFLGSRVCQLVFLQHSAINSDFFFFHDKKFVLGCLFHIVIA